MDVFDYYELNPEDPDSLTHEEFEELWNLKPESKLVLHLGGKDVVCPRYTKSYLNEYRYNSKPPEVESVLPPIIQRIFDAVKEMCPRVNQCLVNWYEEDGYIGYHSDDTRQLVKKSPIFSYSYGTAVRKFRLKNKNTGKIDFELPLKHNILIVMKNDCQDRYMHSAIKTAVKDGGRRVNVTFRCFA